MLHNLKILPSVFAELSREEKIFVMASIQVKTEADKKELKKIKS